MSVGDSEITGTLKYVSGYTDFSDNPEEQSGNYLALKIEVSGSPKATTTVEVVGGTKGEVTLDSDGLIVLLIKNKDTQSVRVKTSANDLSATKTYTLTKMTLNSME